MIASLMLAVLIVGILLVTVMLIMKGSGSYRDDDDD
jgi:hypothetical protein